MLIKNILLKKLDAILDSKLRLIGQDQIRDIQYLTPIRTGYLLSNWSRHHYREENINGFTIYNPTKYAPYPPYFHRSGFRIRSKYRSNNFQEFRDYFLDDWSSKYEKYLDNIL